MLRISQLPRLVAAALLTLTLAMPQTALAQQNDTASAPAAIVDINTASAEQLEMIVADAALARRIVESRPFTNKRQLVSRDLMRIEDYDKIKDRIIARRVQTAPQNED